MNKLKILCLFFNLLSVASSFDQSLKLVQLVYRHGDRSPVASFPKDYYVNYHWPQGLGWLSTKGMQRHYRFGQWLRQQYDGFLNSTYIRSQIEIDSSNENRCLMSAYSNLAGLYPPGGWQLWNNNITWQPIPVHTRPKIEDNVINMGMKCPKYDELYQQTLNSKDVTDMDKINKGFYKFLSKKSGLDVNIDNIWRVADTVYIEDLNNLTKNTWVYQKWQNTTVYDELRRLESIQFHLLYKGTEISKLKGGPLLKEMVDNMQYYIKNKDKPSQTRMHMFSGRKPGKQGALDLVNRTVVLHYSDDAHIVLFAFLSALELYKQFHSPPPYAASVLLELHETSSNRFVVRIFYKQNETYAEPLTLPGCARDCPIDDFVRLTKKVIPVDWKKECGYKEHTNRGYKLTTSEIISIVLAGVLIVTLICLIVTCVKLKRGHVVEYKAFTNT